MGTIQERTAGCAQGVHVGQTQYGRTWMGDIRPVYLVMGMRYSIQAMHDGEWRHVPTHVYTSVGSAAAAAEQLVEKGLETYYAAACVVCVNAAVVQPVGGPMVAFTVVWLMSSPLLFDGGADLAMAPGLAGLRKAVETAMSELFGSDLPKLPGVTTHAEDVAPLGPDGQHAGIEEADRTPATESVDPVAHPDHGTEG